MMITESDSVRRMNQLNISPPLRKLSDGALFNLGKNDGIYTNATAMNSTTSTYPSGGCLVWPNGEVRNSQYVPHAALDLASSQVSPKQEMFSQRKQREFTPDFKKNSEYWDRRRRNNEAAKRSREKRRLNDMVLETKVVKLMRENAFLKIQLAKICENYNIDLKEVLAEGGNEFDFSSFHDPSTLSLLPSSNQQFVQDANLLKKTSECGQIIDPYLDQNGKIGSILELPSPRDARRRHSCGSRPHLVGQDMSLKLPQINVLFSEPEPVVDGMLTPPKEETSSSSSIGSLSPHLPHKLRHKQHLGDKDMSQQFQILKVDSPIDETTCLNTSFTPSIKPEELSEPGFDSKRHDSISSDESVKVIVDDNNNNCNVSTFELKHENDQLRNELHQLASEVASLKDVILSDSGRKRKKSVINTPLPQEIISQE